MSMDRRYFLKLLGAAGAVVCCGLFDEVLIRTPKRFADLLPEWSSVWNKLVVVKPGDDVTIQWPPEGFVTVELT